MPTYLPSQPIAGDDLSISQPKLATNCDALNAIYGFDHFSFTNSSPEQGLHNTVTTPVYQNPIGTTSVAPPATTTYPILYGFQPYTAVGPLQYSRGISNAAPTTLTMRQSPIAASSISSGSPINLLDFTGIPFSICSVYAYDTINGLFNYSVVYWNGSTFNVQKIVSLSFIVANVGNILQLQSPSLQTATYWTMQFLRLP